MTTRSSRGPGGATAVATAAPHVAPPPARPPADGGSGSESSDYDDDEAVFEAAAVRAGAAGELVIAARSFEAKGEGKRREKEGKR